jgi:geranylgeranyl pyrophosphate synthase
MDDLLERLTDQFKEFDDDVRAFAPLVKDVVELQRDILHMRESLSACRQGIDDLRADIEMDRKSRQGEATANRKWTVALAVTILLGFLGLAVQIVLAVSA